MRIHADAEAAEAIRARAYTAGTDVVFARGEFAPATDEGRRLLAHELTHVTQQASASKNHEVRHPRLGMEIGASPMSRVVQRQPNNDLNQSPQTVDPTGKLSPGTTQAVRLRVSGASRSTVCGTTRRHGRSY